MIKEPICLSEHLLSMTQDMYQHACKGDWDNVKKIDDSRHQLIRQAIDEGQSFDDMDLADQLQKFQESILEMAIQERENISTEYNASKNKASNCNYYLKNKTE